MFSKENLKKRKRKTKTNISEKDETVTDLYMLLIGYIIIICFGFWFHTYFYDSIPQKIFNLSIISTIVFPLLLFSYYIFHEIESVRENEPYDSLLAETKLEYEKEVKISDVIPVILFGVAILYGGIKEITNKKGLLKIVAPYLVFSLIFGTVIPNIISYLVIDHHDLYRVYLAADFNFVSVSIAFGLMIISLLLPFFTVYV